MESGAGGEDEREAKRLAGDGQGGGSGRGGGGGKGGEGPGGGMGGLDATDVLFESGQEARSRLGEGEEQGGLAKRLFG